MTVSAPLESSDLLVHELSEIGKGISDCLSRRTWEHYKPESFGDRESRTTRTRAYSNRDVLRQADIQNLGSVRLERQLRKSYLLTKAVPRQIRRST